MKRRILLPFDLFMLIMVLNTAPSAENGMIDRPTPIKSRPQFSFYSEVARVPLASIHDGQRYNILKL